MTTPHIYDEMVTSMVTEWADRIRPHLAGAVEHIVAAGRELIDARAAIPHGGWGRLCSALGLEPRTAHKFMTIARHPTLADRSHGSDLPSAWTTLYELAKVEPEQLADAIEDGIVTPEFGRGQAQDLARRGYRRQLAPPVKVAPVHRSTERDGRCPGCGICGGYVAHYLTTRRPGPGFVRVIYVDGHGVVYDNYQDAEVIPDLLGSYYELEQAAPSGEDAYVLRRPWTDCGIHGCPICVWQREVAS